VVSDHRKTLFFL
jgi:hypothetical protein